MTAVNARSGPEVNARAPHPMTWQELVERIAVYDPAYSAAAAAEDRRCLWCGEPLGEGKSREAVYCSTSCRSRMSQVKRASCVNAMRVTWGWTEGDCADELETVGLADVTKALELHGTQWNPVVRQWERA